MTEQNPEPIQPGVSQPIYTRTEFENLREESAAEMANDEDLQRDALDVLARADRYRWIHQTNWFGEPILQLPQDVLAIQEILFETRPEFIVEVGVAWGGSLLLYSTLMELLGGNRIIGIDVYIPEDLKARIASFQKLSERITWINGSSIDPRTYEQVKNITGDSKDVMVVLDSNHEHEHVLQELNLYSHLVGPGHYLVCSDTLVESIPRQDHRPRAWGPGNNPRTALNQFLISNKNFEIDKKLGNKLLFSCQPDGYLKRRPDSEITE